MLTQIHFNGTNYINAACIFCLTRGLACSWGNGDAQCCQLSNSADPFINFFPFKRAPKPLVSETRWYCHASVRSCFPSTPHARTSLSLSLSLHLLSLAHGREEQGFRLNTDIILLILFYMQVQPKSQHSYYLYLMCI